MNDTDLIQADIGLILANTDTTQITQWKSIITLIVFVVTNIVVLFPFHIVFFIPRALEIAVRDSLSALRVIQPRQDKSRQGTNDPKASFWVPLRFPLNFITAPLIADLFLLAISAIGREEVHDGTIGASNISPIEIMAFFFTLAYIAISIDASGLIRYLAFKVLQWGGEVGHRLYFFLYAFFFLLGSFIGNDPIILSGTAFLAYMTRVSSNIVHPRAWIFSQFAVANIASAILVSSNPTNLVLAGAFSIRFIDYTVNMIVPVVVTAIVLFPFLLYFIFANPQLIPYAIKMHELPEEVRARRPVNPAIPHARGKAAEEEIDIAGDEQKLLSLEEIMNPFLDKGGAAFGAIIMTATLVAVLAINASGKEWPVFSVTLPAAIIMATWDLLFGWIRRKETREIARKGRLEVENARAERAREEEEAKRIALATEERGHTTPNQPNFSWTDFPEAQRKSLSGSNGEKGKSHDVNEKAALAPVDSVVLPPSSPGERSAASMLSPKAERPFEIAPNSPAHVVEDHRDTSSNEMDDEKASEKDLTKRRTLVSLSKDIYAWCQETFPITTAVLAYLPFALVPFALCMFVLVQGLVTKGWVPVFAHGWDHWVEKTGTVGAIGGMGFLSVILCNFAGTNIGTTILLSRVVQAWADIHALSGTPITQRMWWSTIYSMALGVNYGAFSIAFSASLAGLLWRDILGRKHIKVRRLDFARVNLPIIAIAMSIGCTVLVGEMYLTRQEVPQPLAWRHYGDQT